MTSIPSVLIAACLSAPLLSPPASRAEKPAERVGSAVIQAALSFVLETGVTLEGLKLDAETGTLTLTGLKVANPKGFPQGDAVVLKTVTVEASPDALTSKEPEIRRVHVSGATVHATHDLKKGLNIQRLQKSAERVQAQAKPLLQIQQASPTLFRLGTAVLDDCELMLDSPVLLGAEKRVPLDPIEIDYSQVDGGKPITADRALAVAVDRVLHEVMAHLDMKNPLAEILGKP